MPDNAPLTKKQVSPISKDSLENEYVAGGNSYFSSEILSPNKASRAQPDFNPVQAERMRTDAEISSSVEFAIDSMFADGLQIYSAAPEGDADYEKGREIADFCAAAVNAARRSVVSVLRELARGTYYHGVKVGEIVLRYEDNNRFRNKYVLDRINLKPNRATAFVTDKFYNVIGLVGAKRARYTFSSSRISLKPEEIIERRKFIVLAFELEDNDPRGLVPVRTAHDSFRDKQATRIYYKEWLKRCAITQKAGFTEPNAKPEPLRDPETGEYLTYPNGAPRTVSAQERMTLALGEMENNSVFVGPHGADLKVLEVFGTGEQFERSYKLNNQEARKAILGDALATGAADKDARAARESAMDVVDLKIKARKNSVCEAFKQDVLTLLVEENYPPELWHLVPNCSLGDTERRSWATDMRAASAAGWRMTKKQAAEVDVQFGLTPREDGDELFDENSIEEPNPDPDLTDEEEE